MLDTHHGVAAAETQRAKEEAAWEETMTRELEQMEKQRRWARKNRQAGAGAEPDESPERAQKRAEYLRHCADA